MKLSNLNEWLSLVANLGVVGGIVFLGLEINQANRIAINSAESAIGAQAAEVNRSILDSPDDSDFLKNLVSTSEGLQPTDEAKLRGMARQLTNLWITAESAFQNGLISEDNYQIYVADVAIVYDEFPGLVPHFAYLRDLYIKPEMIKNSRIWSEYANEARKRGY